MFKYRLPSLVKYLIPQAVWNIPNTNKVLYLTFDDGPHPEITPYVLELLQQFRAKATFFCVGNNVTKFPETYQKILKNGHLTGNHTFHHLNYFKNNRAIYLNDIELADKVIGSKLFRPPYGKILPGIARTINKNYKIVMWSLLSCDFYETLNKHAALNQLFKARSGDIIVFHDSEKAYHNLQYLLPRMLSHFYQLGFSFQVLPV